MTAIIIVAVWLVLLTLVVLWLAHRRKPDQYDSECASITCPSCGDERFYVIDDLGLVSCEGCGFYIYTESAASEVYARMRERETA